MAALNASTKNAPNPRSYRSPPSEEIAEEGFGWKLQLLTFATAVAVVFSRRPDALLNPQFFGEDGPFWYGDAYNLGWFSALLHPLNGYFQTLPRLAATAALLAPLRYAPLIMNSVGITFQVLPVNFLLSWRCSGWGPLSTRLLMAAIYLALPNTAELNATVEEGQWHLALLACMLAFARSGNFAWQAFDLFIILLSGLTGPFCIFLLPLAVVFWRIRQGRFRFAIIGVLCASAVVQLTALVLTSSATRPRVGLGATPELFVELLGGHVFLAAIFGQSSFPSAIAVAVVAALLGTALLLRCAAKAPMELKLFVCFAILVFAASLRSPMVSLDVPQWRALSESAGTRYWFFPTLAFSWSLVWAARQDKGRTVRAAAICTLACMLIGILRDWRYPAYDDLHFPEYARQFEAAAQGTRINIPTYPPGWSVTLIKKSPGCSSMPSGAVDGPAPDSRLSGQVVVVGWAAAPKTIRQVLIYADRILLLSLRPTLVRTDADKAYRSPDKYKGWSTILDVSKLPPGKHQLEVRARDAVGCEADIGLVPVEVLR